MSVCVFLYEYICMYMRACVYICVYVYVCMCVYIYIYIYNFVTNILWPIIFLFFQKFNKFLNGRNIRCTNELVSCNVSTCYYNGSFQEKRKSD